MKSALTTVVLLFFALLPLIVLGLRAYKPSAMPWWLLWITQIVVGALLILAAAMLNETADGGAPKVFALFFGWAYSLMWFLPWLLVYGVIQLVRRHRTAASKTP